MKTPTPGAEVTYSAMTSDISNTILLLGLPVRDVGVRTSQFVLFDMSVMSHVFCEYRLPLSLYNETLGVRYSRSKRRSCLPGAILRRPWQQRRRKAEKDRQACRPSRQIGKWEASPRRGARRGVRECALLRSSRKLRGPPYSMRGARAKYEMRLSFQHSDLCTLAS